MTRYDDPEMWGSNPHREALKQMDEAERRRHGGCDFDGCSDTSDIYDTDTHRYLCWNHYMEEADL